MPVHRHISSCTPAFSYFPFNQTLFCLSHYPYAHFLILLFSKYFIRFLLLPALLLHNRHAPEAQQDLQHGRTRNSKPDVKQRYRCLSAHIPGNRNPHQKGGSDSLHHHKASQPQSIEISNKAEQETCEHTVNRIRLQIVRTGCNDLHIIRENPRKEIPMEKSKKKHANPDDCRYPYYIPKCAFCAVIPACSPVLCNKRRHRLHKRRRHKHDKSAYLFCNSDPCRRHEAK